MNALTFDDSCPSVDADEQAARYQRCSVCTEPVMPYVMVVLPIEIVVDATRTRSNGRMFWSSMSWVAYQHGLRSRTDAYIVYCLDPRNAEEMFFALSAMTDRAVASLPNINAESMPPDVQAAIDAWKRETGRLYEPPPRSTVIVQRQRRPKRRKSTCNIQ